MTTCAAGRCSSRFRVAAAPSIPRHREVHEDDVRLLLHGQRDSPRRRPRRSPTSSRSSAEFTSCERPRPHHRVIVSDYDPDHDDGTSNLIAGAFARRGLDGQPAAEVGGTVDEQREPEVAFLPPGGGDGGIEPFAVVPDQRDHGRIIALEVDGHVGRVRMVGDVPERLLRRAEYELFGTRAVDGPHRPSPGRSRSRAGAVGPGGPRSPPPGRCRGGSADRSRRAANATAASSRARRGLRAGGGRAAPGRGVVSAWLAATSRLYEMPARSCTAPS